jgi:hypothetical protein
MACLLVVLGATACGKSNSRQIDEKVSETIAELDKEIGPRAFECRKDALHRSLKPYFVPFSFSYPTTWEVLQDGTKPTDSNFVKIERKAAPHVTGESFTVGSLVSPPGVDPEAYAKSQLGPLEAQFAQGYPAYRKVADEAMTLDGRKTWGFRFASHFTKEQTGDVEGDLWGLVLAVPNVIENRGVVIILQGTSRSGVLQSAADLGVRGELPGILSTLKFKK